MARIFWGIVFVAAGILITLYGDTLYENFGVPEFAERYFGGRFFVKLLGIIATIVGFFVITNLHRNVILWVLSIFFPNIQ